MTSSTSNYVDTTKGKMPSKGLRKGVKSSNKHRSGTIRVVLIEFNVDLQRVRLRLALGLGHTF